MNIYWLGVSWSPYIRQAVVSEWDVMYSYDWQNGRAGCYPVGDYMVERTRTVKKFFKGYVVRRRGDVRSFGDHVSWERR